MIDDEREAQIRERLTRPRNRNEALGPSEIAFLLNCLDEARAEIAWLTEELADTHDDYLRRHKDACERWLRIRELEAEIARLCGQKSAADIDKIAGTSQTAPSQLLRAPPITDAMEIAKSIVRRCKLHVFEDDDEIMIARAIEAAVRAERERCAQLATGEIYQEHYRTWPWFGTGTATKDDSRVLFCDALATKIREGQS